ncbi:MAG: peptide chain release factor N(5)-glutamine methyltransferase [Verrucomicrobia bacterium]|nr:peptide chain release factor N(5)-glutamine methyltransferase [Verrucomicrobiota bacterium]
MKTVGQVIALCTEYLQSKKSVFGRLEAEHLMAHALGLKRIDLYLNFERPLEETELLLIRQRLSRLAKNEPLQYIEGQVSFYNCLFHVNRSVLIPRPETELLIDTIVKELQKRTLKGKTLWDVCAGSGCIGIAIKKALPELQVVLSDISRDALDVARKNSAENGVDVAFVEGDLLTPFDGTMADFVVSNPPYVSAQEYLHLDAHVRDYEPKTALVGGKTGLEFYEKLSLQLKDYVKSGGSCWFELGAGQKESVVAMLRSNGYFDVRSFKDFSGCDRFVVFDV